MCVYFFIVLFVSSVWGFLFDLNAKDYRCFTEELPTNFDVFGDYDIGPGFSQSIDFRVQDPRGQNIVTRQEVDGAGEFTFIAREGVPYHFGLSRRIKFKLLTGTETKDYQGVAKREHLKPVEINLRMMEDIVKEIYSEYNYLKKRDEASTSTSETIYSRVFTTALISLVIIVGFGTWQILYLRRFFKERKIV